MPLVTVRGPSGSPVEIAIDKDAITVGRALTNDVVLNDPNISWNHTRIERTNAGWVVTDLESRNGTRLNGRIVDRPSPLESGDVISIGATILAFDAEAQARGRGPAAAALRRTWADEDKRPPSREPVLIGESQAMRALLGAVEKLARSSGTVLVSGESGTGKELVARLIHLRSSRSSGPFVPVNCPALPGTLIEAELFGVEKGVATGVDARIGRFETAQGGTLFLDEIGDLDLAAQAKILRSIQEREFEKVGGRAAIPLDVRFVAATNHDLEAAVAKGTFRRDLYHRLKVITIQLPALRERREDIPLLAAHFLATREGPATGLAPEALEALRLYDFPGNVRELQHLLDHARWQATGAQIEPDDLPEDVRRAGLSKSGAVNDDIERLLARIVRGDESFWDVVKAPLKRRELSKDDARRLVRRARDDAGGSYKEMARLFHMEGEYKRLLNFLGKYELGVRRKGE